MLSKAISPSLGREEIEESWRWCDELIDACKDQNVPALPYQAGSWGPAKAEVLIEKDFGAGMSEQHRYDTARS